MTDTPHILWNRCMEVFHNNLDESQFKTWFMPIKFKSYDSEKNELTLYTPSQYFHEHLEEHFRKLIVTTIYRVFGKETRLIYEVEVVSKKTITITEDAPVYINEKRPGTRAVNQSPTLTQAVGPAEDLDSQLNTKQNFNNFIAGASNQLPRSIGQSIAEKPNQQAFNPLFIYGPSGVGKTHLVNAIGTRLKELHPEKRVLYLSAHLFEVQFTDSRRKNTFNDFMYFYQSIDVLIIDDIQEMIGKVQTQYAFFHIFNHLRQNGRQIILTSDRPPMSLQGMEDRLVTRFKSGLIAELEKPELELRKNILEYKIKHDGLNIPEDVIEYISENVSDSVREMEGVIHSLLAYSVVYNKEVDLEFAERILKHNQHNERKKITLDMIIESTCEYFDIKQDEIYGKSRKSNVVLVRQMSMYLAQKHTKMTASKIGVLIGNRNHATVIHSVKTIDERLKVDNKLRKSFEELEKKLQCK